MGSVVHLWNWLSANSTTLEGLSASFGAVLAAITIGVLIITWQAIKRQAVASEKLIDATMQQIAASKEQAQAARDEVEVAKQQIATSNAQAKSAAEQVEVARRQITESLRPILLTSVVGTFPRSDGSNDLRIDVINEGAGAALDVWCTFGRPGSTMIGRCRVAEGIIAPGKRREFKAHEPSAVSVGVLVVYTSISGISSGTQMTWRRNNWEIAYLPDITDWVKALPLNEALPTA